LFTVYLIYINPYFNVGLQYQATWRALCYRHTVTNRHDAGARENAGLENGGPNKPNLSQYVHWV